MTAELLIVDRAAEGVAVVTLNRPEALNALSRELHRTLHVTVVELADDPSVGAIVLAGAGERAFSAGYDIKEEATYGRDEMLAMYLEREPWHWGVASCPVPVIAAVHGVAWGGGAVLATSADIRVGSSRTSFRVTATAYGGVNATWHLPPIVGVSTAKDWLMTAREVRAEELYVKGWLNHVVEPGEELAKAVELAGQIVANDPAPTQAAKRLVNASWGRTQMDSQRAETALMATDLRPGDAKELFADFLGSRSSSGDRG